MTEQPWITSSASVIWKFPLMPGGAVDMPSGANVLSVGQQGAQIVIWAAVNPAAPLVPRWFWLIATGEPFVPVPAKRFIGTVQMPNGLVWHVVEETRTLGRAA